MNSCCSHQENWIHPWSNISRWVERPNISFAAVWWHMFQGGGGSSGFIWFMALAKMFQGRFLWILFTIAIFSATREKGIALGRMLFSWFSSKVWGHSCRATFWGFEINDIFCKILDYNRPATLDTCMSDRFFLSRPKSQYERTYIIHCKNYTCPSKKFGKRVNCWVRISFQMKLTFSTGYMHH